MKISLSSFLIAADAALAVFILLHLELELVTAIIFVTGFSAIVFHDYGRRPKTRSRETATPFSARNSERLPLAG